MTTVPPADFAAPERYTDVGNARRLVASHGHELRYVPQWSTWLVWDGRRWQRDHDGIVYQRAKAVAAALWEEAQRETDSDARKAAVRWALQSEAANRIRAMVEMARTEPGIPTSPADLDADPWAFNVANGTIDLRNGSLRPHDPRDQITKLAPVTYDARATAPTWQRFLEQIVPDIDVRLFLQRAAGYTLTGSVREQIVIFLHGLGANGKSTFLDALLALTGEYGKQADPELLVDRAEAAHPTAMAELAGRRLAVTSELEEGKRLAEATVKRLTDSILKGRFMRQDFFEVPAQHKVWVAANHKPIVRGTDHAIWRRLRLVPFEVIIAEHNQDKDLPAKLLTELPGILAWAVDGVLGWQRDGLPAPDAITVATSSYRAEMDVVGAFIAEECIVMAEAWASAGALYAAYVDWCDVNGERPVSQRRLGMALTERGHDRRKHGPDRRWAWFGIGLVNPTGRKNPSDPDPGMNAHTRAHVSANPEMGSEGFKGSEQQRLPYKDHD
jgi:putative DNA primase/helicase